jgi:hypothetical protein
MKKLTCSLALIALIGLGLSPNAASAAGTVTVYFNSAGTLRTLDSPGVGVFQTVHIYGEGFPGQFISGAQYKVDYGPNFTFFQDIPEGGIVIGNSPNGISIGFGINIKLGAKFKTQRAILIWNSDCATTGAVNANVSVVKHPDFPDATPIFTRFPDQNILVADGRRSQICQLVEMDFSPALCPNHFSAKAWEFIGSSKPWKAGVTAVAVLGSSTVNVNDIDNSSLLLNGVAPLAWPQTTWFDIGKADGDDDCACDFMPPSDDDDDDDEDNEDMNYLINFNPDGKKDLLVFFRNVDLAASIGGTAPVSGTELTLTLKGTFDDGMPFTAQDCVTIIDGRHGRHKDHDDSDDVAAGLGLPSPNPFNPVTRISYDVPTTQHVRIAIYNVAGQLVENLVNEVKAPGSYMIEWNAGNLPSGVYFYRMQTGSETIVRRATLLK